MARHWILQSNPKRWDVWDWWENETTELESWTISVRVDQVQPGDDFALWIGGAEAGVYAYGTVTAVPEGPHVVHSGGLWIEAPTQPVWDVPLQVTSYLFSQPILKAELAADPRFASALILRVPRSANPIPLTPTEWSAITTRVRGRKRQPTRPAAGQPVHTVRAISRPSTNAPVYTPEQQRLMAFREARLLKRFEKSSGRPLECRAVRLPSGERLICDAYDPNDDLLIEAKASASRQDIRMAIGQLLDYRRHLGSRKSSLAVLVPDRPTPDLLDLLHRSKIRLIYRDGTSFLEA
jgi:hypothetical protein